MTGTRTAVERIAGFTVVAAAVAVVAMLATHTRSVESHSPAR